MNNRFHCRLFENGTSTSRVIDNPVSAVKQLIENSIDANCTKVLIKIDESSGGCRYIQLNDDGNGISVQKRSSVFVKHFKTDGKSCKRIGYKGRALYNIGKTASKKGSIEVITRTISENVAVKWSPPRIRINETIRFSKVVNPPGTTVILRDLMTGSKSSRLAKKDKNYIKMIRDMLFHFSLIHKHICFSCQLVNPLRDGSIKALEYVARFGKYEDRMSQFKKHVTKQNLIVEFEHFDEIELSESLKVNIILPKIRTHGRVTELMPNLKYPCINGEAVMVQSGFGKKVNHFFKEFYKHFGKPEPRAWFIQFLCHHTSDNAVVNGENKAVALTLEKALSILQCSLLTFYAPHMQYNDPSHSTHIDSESVIFTRRIINTSDIPKQIHRQITNNPTQQILEKESEWLTDMYSGTLSDGRSSPVRENLLYSDIVNTEDCCIERDLEDVELSRNTTLSNPFILSRIRARNTTEIVDDQIKSSGILETYYQRQTQSSEFFQEPTSKRRRILENDPEYDHSTTLVDIEHTVTSSSTKNLDLQFEHTFNLGCRKAVGRSVPWKLRFLKNAYKKELVWFHRSGMPSLPLLDGIQTLMEGEDSDVDLQLILMPTGWFMIAL